MTKIEILGVKVDALTKEQVLSTISGYLSGEKTGTKIITTAYSEFIVAANNDERFRNTLNSADLNLADGIGILWSAAFLNKPLKIRNQGLKILEIALQFLVTAWQTAFNQQKIKNVIPEQISGADLIYDICKLAQEKGSGVYFLGGRGDIITPLKKQFPNLRIAGRYEGSPDEPDLINKINQADPDILLVAYGPIKQEYWLNENCGRLNTRVAVGLGGTFDYITGRRPRAGRIWRKFGLEWLFRLLTQPWRAKRMWNAIVVFSWLVLKEKFRQK